LATLAQPRASFIINTEPDAEIHIFDTDRHRRKRRVEMTLPNVAIHLYEIRNLFLLTR
jgi:hypothetical protein